MECQFLKPEENEFLRVLELYIGHTKRIILNNEDTRREARCLYSKIRHGPLPGRLSRMSQIAAETSDILDGGLVSLTWNPELDKYKPQVLKIQDLDIKEDYNKAVEEAESLREIFVKNHNLMNR